MTIMVSFSLILKVRRIQPVRHLYFTADLVICTQKDASLLMSVFRLCIDFDLGIRIPPGSLHPICFSLHFLC